MQSISSRQNPIVRAFRELAADPPTDGSRVLLDGVHLVREAHEAGLTFERVAVSARHLENGSEVAGLAEALMRDGVNVVAVTAPVMDALSPVKTPSGIIAIASRQSSGLAEICRHPKALVVAPVSVQDPGNLGALVRAAEAGGATGVVVCGASASPFSWKAVRGSMGSVLRLPVASGVSAESVIGSARIFGAFAVASAPRGGRPPQAIDWRRSTVVFVGGEGEGLSTTLLDACDDRVTIPMEAPVESLNVAVAAALLVYEARRQRRERAQARSRS